MIGKVLLLGGLALGATPAGNIVPEAQDFRLQKIEKAASEKDWPFVAGSGMLACAFILREPAVYFLPSEGGSKDRAFVIDTDIYGMAFANIGITGVLKPYENFEQLLKRISPYVSLGRRLCNQPPGTIVSGSEL
jgi:hypothetical protein